MFLFLLKCQLFPFSAECVSGARFCQRFSLTRRFNNIVVKNRFFTKEKVSVGKLLLEQIKVLFIQAVGLEEMAVTQVRSLIGTF